MIHDTKEADIISPLAGKRAPTSMLVDLRRLEREYYERKPEIDDPTQVVSFGTSGHRGSPFRGSFTEAHIAAITQAICDYRRGQRIDGPLYMGKDTHACPSRPSAPPSKCWRPTASKPSSSATTASRRRPSSRGPSSSTTAAGQGHLADGIVVTPSHNPPEDGGFKYNPPNGGPADTDVTRWVQNRANELLRERQRRREAGAVRDGPQGRDAPTRKISSCPTSQDLEQRRRHGGDPRAPASRWAWIRSAGRRRRTGSRSTPSTSSNIAVVNPGSTRRSRS